MKGSVLSKDKILERVEKGDIKISPYSIDNVCPAGYEIQLGIIKNFKV